MCKRIAAATAASALIGLLVALGAQQAQAAPANECLSAPNGASPNGQHWYYHLDRANNRKCWYLRAIDASRAVGASVDTKQAQAEPPKSAAQQTDSSAVTDPARMPASAAGDTADASAAAPAVQMNAPDLPRSAEPVGLTAAAEDNQPSTVAEPEALQQPAPQLSQADAAVGGATEAPTGSAAGAAVSAEKKEPVRQDIQSLEPAVPSTPSVGTIAENAIVITAAGVAAVLAVLILLLVRRRRRRTPQDAPLPDHAMMAPEQAATAAVLDDAPMQELLRLLAQPPSAPRVEREHAG
jgi:hypothetical protein